MFKSYNSKFNKDVVEIFVGEFYVTNKSEIIMTLLGSCISVCIIDDTNNICGMNHFLLPSSGQASRNDDGGRFGERSMELLISDILRMGSIKKNLKAKVFGGAKVLKTQGDIIRVNEDNINFIHEFLEIEGIEILSEDIGGIYGRKIYFNTEDGSVYVKKIADMIE